MSPHTDLPSRTSTARSAMSRDAGLLRLRTATKGVTAAAALGSVALGLMFASTSHAASSPAAAVSTQSTQAPAAPSQSDDQQQQQQLAAPPQPPAQVAPQV